MGASWGMRLAAQEKFLKLLSDGKPGLHFRVFRG